MLAPAVASIPTYVLPPVPADREPTRMVDLIRTEMVDGPTVSFYRTTGPTASSAWLAEGAAKPESALSYTQVTATVHKAPTWVGVSTEALADYSGFAGIVEADLLAGLELFENNQILNGPGTGVTQLGLLNQTGILTLTPGAAQPRILTIRDAITNLRNGAAYAVPDAIIMNPTDVGTTPEYAASTGELVVSPNPTANQPLAFWGVPVLQTSQIAAGTALIGAFAKSTVNYVNEAPTLKVDP